MPVNDWGYYCDAVVTWWLGQAAFGDDEGQRRDRLRHGGYKIGGSLDPQLQQGAKQRVDQVVAVGDGKLFTLATIEPGTGLIRAMAVNRNFRRPPQPSPSPTDQGQPPWRASGPDLVDPLVAGNAETPGDQAGAPFLMFTLAAALESGLTLDHAIDTKRRYTSKYVIDPNSPAACDGPHYCPANSGDPAYLSGRRTMWDAFRHAVVTYFIPLEEQLGADTVIAMSKRLGIGFRAPADKMLSDNGKMWGSFTLGVSATTTLDLANAYATLAADGKRCDPVPVAKVDDAGGQAVEGIGPRCEQVLRPEVARAALDAARCPVGDKSAFGDKCGGGTVPATTVRATVGRPVAGQSGQGANRQNFSLVVAAPQLVTAGMIGAAPGQYGGTATAPLATDVPGKAIAAIATVQRDGLAPLPARDFTAPPQELAIKG
ncbi:penicillin-binding transpeptidase domain-containing protein [Dactylosporangium sp. CS-033363]|uniref:penicillin-binding transpeptidase domain-containing protein n=1 Tax=Dactylosporangium sp. CS-033363 TaxID=3239935 RepID=UPI003D8B0809